MLRKVKANALAMQRTGLILHLDSALSHPIYCSFLHSMLPPEGLEAVDNTKASKIGQLKVTIIAMDRTGRWEGKKGWLNSVEIWDGYYEVYNYLEINYFRIKLS